MFEKFDDVVKSWAPRILDTLAQRVEVLKVFFLSRVYYVASILTIRKTLVKKFEQVMRNFLWRSSGKVLWLPLENFTIVLRLGGWDCLPSRPCVAHCF